MTAHDLTWFESVVIGFAAIGLSVVMVAASAFLLWLADRLDGTTGARRPTTWVYDSARNMYLPPEDL